MYTLFIVGTKLICLFQIFKIVTDSIQIVATLIQATDMYVKLEIPMSTTQMIAMQILVAVLLCAFFILLFVKADWFAKKLGFEKDAAVEIKTNDLLNGALKILGVYVLVTGVPSLINEILKGVTYAKMEFLPGDHRVSLASYLISLVVGVALLVRTGKVVEVLDAWTRKSTARIVVGVVAALLILTLFGYVVEQLVNNALAAP